MATYMKDPDALLPFTIDWSEWATQEDDDLATATWAADDGIVVETFPPPQLLANKATVWLSGGDPGERYGVTCSIVTAGGREDDRSFKVLVLER